ncbi:winged helix family two component transcriptional regulator [Geothermobacter ehrlichii]|uniref:Winged helix family two component transcriptional regulator n=1 Tax=Geothermobacter ehrlichii TaxID=213224 RepID=A0A5D3WL67_9BACT|nr:response regulator transcription factor [Geothermobacter ehrlichii]TYO99005.1 winged helix family two component transcriptional regulator [Geothermobacter ehrlichii]
MSTPTILLIEDEQHIAEGLIFNLEAEGYRVLWAQSGEEGLELLQREQVSLLVLDLMLPGISGYEVCRRLRTGNPRLPVLILSARAEERDRVKGLALGADDYLIKPFSLDEFLLRVRGMLKRAEWYQAKTVSELVFGDNRIDLRQGTATTARGELTLTEQELKLLRVLAERAGEVVDRTLLLKEAWGMRPETATRTLDNFIVRLRRYFEPDPARPRHFLTVRGRGYRLVLEPEKTA